MQGQQISRSKCRSEVAAGAEKTEVPGEQGGVGTEHEGNN